MLIKDIKDNDKNQMPNKDFLPEQKPNSEPLLIVLPPATLAQNALLYEATPINFFYQFFWYKKIDRCQ